MNRQPLSAVTSRHRQEYQDVGVTVVRKVFDDEWIDRLLVGADLILCNPGLLGRDHTKDPNEGRFHVNMLMSQRLNIFRELALKSPAVEIARSILGVQHIRFFYDQLFFKAPRTSTRTQWHQDLPFWPVVGTQIPSIWVALTTTDESSSAVQYIGGSHQWGKSFVPIDPNEMRPGQLASAEICPEFHLSENSPAVGMICSTLEPGDVVVHHPLIVHGAAGNSDDIHPRVAVSLRYFGPDVYWNIRPRTMFFPGVTNLLPHGESVFQGSFFPDLP